MNSVPPLEPGSIEGQPLPSALVFGPWRLDRRSGELRRGDTVVRLQEQPRKVLELLVLRAGDVVTRDELIGHVWPRGAVIDFDTGINTAIRKLRAVLGDDAEAPRYIETLPRRGYRLLTVPAADAPPVSGGAARSGRPWRAVVALAAGAVLVAFLAVMALRPGVPAGTIEGGTAATAEPLPSNTIAVLPFQRLGEGAVDETLALGVAESVLHRLSASPDLVVIARGSAFAFRQPSQDPTSVGRALHARYLLDGTVQTAQDRLRLTTRLIDAQSGRTVWSLRFDRRVADVFALQDEIASQVARLLRVSLEANASTIEGQGTDDVDAYIEFLQGRNLTVSRRVADLREAEAHLQRATARDPRFAAAFAELARVRDLLLTYDPPGDVATKKTRWAQAQATARRALELAPASASSLVAVGTLSDDPRATRDYLRRAISMNPNYALAWQQLAEHLLSHGVEDPEALQTIDSALRLDPLQPRLHYLKALYHMQAVGDAAEAERQFQATLRVDPEYYAAHARLAQLDACCTGRLAEAVRHAEQALKLDPDARWVQRLLVGLYLDLGDTDAARDVLAAAATPEPGAAILVDLYDRDPEAAARRLLDPANDMLLSWSEGRDVRFLWRVPLLVPSQAPLLARFAERVRDRAQDPSDPTPSDAPERLTLQLDLAAVLQKSGDVAEARRELAALLAGARRHGDVFSRGWPETLSVALALDGRDDAAMDVLENSTAAGPWPFWWYYATLEPAFAPLRDTPRFTAWVERQRTLAATERAKLRALRVAGVIPQRGSTGQS